jgi:hypothetical protein
MARFMLGVVGRNLACLELYTTNVQIDLWRLLTPRRFLQEVQCSLQPASDVDLTSLSAADSGLLFWSVGFCARQT